MQRILSSTLALLLAVAIATPVHAGNPDRSGSAGAGQLLILPWALSSGVAGANTALVTGVESSFSNVAGMAFVNRTELAVCNQQYLVGTDIQLNSAGFVQAVGGGHFGLTVTSMTFGEIEITTEDLPEGGIGAYRPTFSNIGISYAKAFSNSIYGGLTVRMISESISNVRANGVAFDAGIRYLAGDDGRLKFGISLRNVGAPMRYGGDGLTLTATPQGAAESLTIMQRSERFELPSLVNIGFGYEMMRREGMTLTGMGQFTSNSFTRDQVSGGLELNLRDRFMLRAGYLYEDGIGDEAVTRTAITGPSAGLSVLFPTNDDGAIGLHYGYRTTNPFDGIHSIGLNITM
jgi:hypothetical protein